VKKGTLWGLITLLIVASMILASCSSSTTATTATTTSSTTITTTTTTTATTSLGPTTTSTATSTTSVTVTASTTSTGNWWDTLGAPQYGGTMTVNDSTDPGLWDPNGGSILSSLEFLYMDSLFGADWTANPSVQNYQLSYWDESYVTGDLLSDWEFNTPGVLTMHVRKGVYWQNLPPVNGRELTSADILFHMNRMAGLGSGYTAPVAYYVADAWVAQIKSVAAPDNWTVVMTFGTQNPEFIFENMEAPGCDCTIENPEAVQAYTTPGNPELTNWRNAVGTGPFILTDFVDNSSATFVRNPNYWATDERHPANRLPYVSNLKILIIGNLATAEAAMRAGKIDIMDTIPTNDAVNMKKTNPTMNEIAVPLGNGLCIDPRDDLAPFTNLNVRIALQEAINLPQIASQYFGGGCDPSPLPLTSNFMPGWGYPYSTWTAAQQAQYAYSPTNAKALLAAANFPNGFTTDITVDSSAPYQDLIQILQSEFAAINVNMSITLMAHSQFSAFVVTGHHETGLCYRTSGSLGLGYYPIRQLMKFQTGGSSNDMMVSDPKIDGWYASAMNATSVDQIKQIVHDENVYVINQNFLLSLVQPYAFFLCQPWLKGFNGQYGSTCGTVGPLLGFQYESRYWIDPSAH
jgi:peptide/nickel transport system substrate-binding protein